MRQYLLSQYPRLNARLGCTSHSVDGTRHEWASLCMWVPPSTALIDWATQVNVELVSGASHSSQSAVSCASARVKCECLCLPSIPYPCTWTCGKGICCHVLRSLYCLLNVLCLEFNLLSLKFTISFSPLRICIQYCAFGPVCVLWGICFIYTLTHT